MQDLYYRFESNELISYSETKWTWSMSKRSYYWTTIRKVLVLKYGFWPRKLFSDNCGRT